MSNLLVSPKWNSFINKVDAGEEITGGDLGNANIATRQLAENVMFLRDSMFTLVADATGDLSQAIVESNKKTKDEFDIIAGLIEAQNGIIIAEAQAREEAISASNTKIAEEAAARIEELGLQSVALQEEIDARKEAFRLEHISRAESEAAFTESLEEVLTEAEASVKKVENLSSQLIGGYDGSNLDFVTEGLLFQQKNVTSTAIKGLSEQISMLSAGVGEQFDTAEIWHFDKDKEDWINGVFDVGYLTVKSETVTSPTFSIDGDVYHHLKMRINKVGDPDWAGNLVWNSGSITLPEPVFVDDVTVVTLDTTWSGDITQLQLKLSTDADDTNYYKIDWITIGRPSPGASTASVLDLKIATATRDEALAQDIRGLSTKMDTDNALLSSDINAKLETITTQQQTQATDITTLSSNVDTMNTKLSADIVEVNSTLVTKETALAESIAALRSKTNESEASVLTQLQTLTDADSALGTQVDALTATFDKSAVEITAQNLVFAAEDLAQANQISQLTAKVDGNIAEVNTQIETLTDAESANANKFTSITAEFQALNDKTDASDAEIRVNAAAIIEESNTRANDILAQATRIDVLTTEVGENAASATSKLNLLSLEDKALAERLDVLTASTDNTNADINLRLTALADEDSAFSEQLTQVMSAVDDNDSAVHERVTALTTATDAEAEKLTLLTAEVGANSAEILTTSRATATNAGAIAEFNTRLTVEYLPKVENIESNILNAVKQTDVQYYLSISETQPIGGLWLTTAPVWEPSKYMFQRMETTYVDGTVKYTPGENGTNISGAKGDKGLDGKDGSDGVAGIQGPSGATGIQGPVGADGTSSYTHLAYATSKNGDGFSTGYFETATYIGMYVDNIKEDSENYVVYNWSLIKGADGAKGIPGVKGSDGKTSYLHIAYANSPDGAEGFSTTASIGKTYIGQYTDFLENDSTNYTLYSWTLIKGEKGDQGPIGLTGLEGPKGDKGIQGPMGPMGPAGPEGLRGLTGLEGLQGDQGIRGEKGEDGLSSYTHIAYATSATGANFNTGHFASATYIGMYVDNNKTDSTDPSTYKWTLIKGADGANGIPGPKGTDGKTSYLHIAYANNVTGNIGFSTTVSEGKTHIGQYTDFELVDNEDYTKYNWTLIKGDKGDTGPIGLQGVPGIEGKAGANGIQGPKGADGTSSYTHLAYATSVTGTNFNTAWYPTATYIGMYVDRTETDSVVPSTYNWSLIKGADGANGIAGPKGTDGKTTYLHIAYANSEAGAVGFSTTVSAGKAYIGQYTDTTLGDSEDYSIYSWSLIKGADGLSSYAHLAYATSATGTNFNTNHFQGATYIGMYVDNTEADSTDYTKYNWSLIKGADGSQGIPGPTGEDGKTSYLHVAYATSATGAVGFSTTVSEGKTYIGQYTDFELVDSPSYTKYKWSLIKGEKGDTGPQGPIGLTGVRGLEGPRGATGLTGSVGAVGQGVDTITSEYAVSTSKTVAPTTWSTDKPVWSVGKYVWTRSKIVYKNPVSTSYTTAIADSSWEAVNEIKVGGRNLVKGSATMIASGGWPRTGNCVVQDGIVSSVSNGSENWVGSNFITVNANEEYTVSIKARGTDLDIGLSLPLYYDGAWKYPYKTYGKDTGGQWITITETFIPKTTGNMRVAIHNHYNTTGTVEYKELKIEKGNKATDWTPAPEDISTEIISATDTAVQSTEIEYYLSTSATSPVGGLWLTTAPEWQQSKYMFSRTKITLSTGVIYKPSANGTNITGAKGDSTYAHLAYATGPTGQGIQTEWFAAATYIGMYVDSIEADSTVATSYKWSLIKGADGANGIQGPVGANGLTAYLHIAYATSANGSVGFSTTDSVGKTYIGQYTDNILADSTSYASYNWTLIKGETGNTGAPGSTGAVGQGVNSIIEQYAVSTSKTVAPTTWTTTMPVWSYGLYVWSRSMITYKNPVATEYTQPLVDSSWEAVNNLEVGSRNLFTRVMLQSLQSYGTIITTAVGPADASGVAENANGFETVGGNNNLAGYAWFDNIITAPGTYTVSCDIRGTQNNQPSVKLELCGLVSPTLAPTNGPNNYGKISYTFVVENIATKQFRISNLEWVYYKIKNIKIERGNKATDWTPAPEDVSIAIQGSLDIGNKITNDFGQLKAETKVLTEIGGKISGWKNLNNGNTSSFDILADNFSIGNSGVMKKPFSIVGNDITFNGKVSFNSMTDTGVIDKAVNDINNLEIGGRNLITQSIFPDASVLSKGVWDLAPTATGLTGQVDYLGTKNAILISVTDTNSYILKTIKVYQSTGNHTVSFWIKGNKAGNLNVSLNRQGSETNVPVTTSWVKHSITINITSISNLYKIVFGGWSSWADISLAVYLSHIKVEKGNKATDWTPAPEDIQGEINQTLIDSKNYTDSIEVGGRNLLKNSIFPAGNTFAGWTVRLPSYTVGNLDYAGGRNAVIMKADVPESYILRNDILTTPGFYTISFWAKGNKAGSVLLSMNNRQLNSRFDLTTAWKYYDYTINITSKVAHHLVFGGYESWSDISLELHLSHIKVEKGNKATDWSPAIEDVDAAITAINTSVADITSDGKVTPNEKRELLRVKDEIVSTHVELLKSVNTVPGAAVPSTYTTAYSNVTTRLTSTAASPTTTTNITASDRTNLTAALSTYFTERAKLNDLLVTKTKAYTESQAAAAKNAAIDWSKVKDTRNANSDPNWYRTNYNWDTAREFKALSTIGLSAGGAYCYVETIVKYGDSSGGAVTQSAYTDDNKMFTRIGHTTTWTAWVESESSAGAQAKANAALDAAKIDAEARAKVAREAAAAAQKTADDATLLINDISADNKLTPVEKQSLVISWTEIQKYNDDSIARALSYGVSSTNYAAAYTALSNYITPILSSMTTTTTIVRNTFNGHFSLLFTRRSELDLAIANKADLNDKIIVIDSTTKKFISPAGYSSNGATGYLIIETPIMPARMCKVHISGYNYVGSKSSIDLSVGMYVYPNTFINYDYTDTGTYPIGNVRLGYKNGKAVIIVGNANSVWSYPKIEVTSAIVGYENPPDSYKDGWVIRVSTSIADLAGVITIDNNSSISLQGIHTNVYYPATTEINGGNIRTKTIAADSIVANSITAGQIAANTITATQMTTDSITARELKAGTVAATHIVGNTITGDKLVVDAITSREIKAGSITAASGAIADLAVTTAKIANLAVSTAKIADLAVKSAQIDNLAVTSGKIANLAVDTLKIADRAVTFPLAYSYLGDRSITGEFITVDTYQDGTNVIPINVATLAKFNFVAEGNDFAAMLNINFNDILKGPGDNNGFLGTILDVLYSVNGSAFKTALVRLIAVDTDGKKSISIGTIVNLPPGNIELRVTMSPLGFGDSASRTNIIVKDTAIGLIGAKR